jgi:hypothetical protein
LKEPQPRTRDNDKKIAGTFSTRNNGPDAKSERLRQRGHRIHHDDRREGSCLFPTAIASFTDVSEMNILTITWFEPVAQNRLSEIRARLRREFRWWLHGFKAKIHRKE